MRSPVKTEQEEDNGEAHAPDARQITAEQKHVFDKALGALPGSSTALPEELKAELARLKTARGNGISAQRAKFVTASTSSWILHGPRLF